MRLRTIKPGFFHNEALADIHPLGRILFAGLWCLADREGRLEDRPKRIKAEILPYDDCDVNALLDDLARSGFILRYVAQDSHFIWIVKFRDHQYPHIREAASIIPAPDEHSASMVLAPDKALAQPVGYSVNPLIRSSVHPLTPVPLQPEANAQASVKQTLKRNSSTSPSPSPSPSLETSSLPPFLPPSGTTATRKTRKEPPQRPQNGDELLAVFSVAEREEFARDYAGFDLRREAQKCVDWYASNGRMKSPRLAYQNWLDKGLRMRADGVRARPADNGHGPPVEEPLDPSDPEWADKQSERERRRQAARYSTGGG